MRIDCGFADIRSVKADMVVVNLFEGTKRPGGAAAHVDAASGRDRGGGPRRRLRGKLGKPFPSVLQCLSSPRVLVVGLGRRRNSPRITRARPSAVLKAAKALKLSTVASVVHGAGAGGVDPGAAARFCALGAALSAFEYDRYKDEKAHRVARFFS